MKQRDRALLPPIRADGTGIAQQYRNQQGRQQNWRSISKKSKLLHFSGKYSFTFSTTFLSYEEMALPVAAPVHAYSRSEIMVEGGNDTVHASRRQHVRSEHADETKLWTMSALAHGRAPVDSASRVPAECTIVADWMQSYLMRPHPDLGRIGDVCPFTAQAARLDLVRIGVSDADGKDAGLILRTMIGALRAFDAIDCKKSMRNFRTVLIAFPNCAHEEGVRALKDVQRRLRHHSTVRGKMIGCFEPNSQDRGLLNPNFRPLRSPIPLLAVRALVENDAPFVIRNPLLAPIYLAKFRLAGMRRLIAVLRA